MDADEQRAESRDRWEEAAAAWESEADLFYAGAEPVSRWMVDRLDPQPGQTVLELAAGRGDTAFVAADRLQPDGRLIVTDGAEAMVEAARRRGEALGIQGAEYRPMELEWVDEAAASIDGILCRFGYMLALDPEAALREARRVLKPGGRLVLAVWDTPEANPWLAVPPQESVRAGHLEASLPGTPGPFALSDVEALRGIVEAAGFLDPLVEPIDLTFTAPSLDALWNQTRAMSSTLRDVLTGLSPAEHYALRDAVDARWAPYVGADGAVAMPGRALGLAVEA